MKHVFKYMIGATALLSSLAAAQDAPLYEVQEQNPVQIESFAGLSADDWAARFIGLAQKESGITAQNYTYDPDDLESMRLYISIKLSDLTVSLSSVIDRFDQKAHALDDARNIKIASMLQAYLKAQGEPLSAEDYDARISDITRAYARDNDWFVVFFANALNFEAGINEGVFDPAFANFAEFALKGHESDLDHDEARLIYLRMRVYDYLRRNDLEGFFNTLEERNDLKVKFGLPKSDFADLINAASLHHAIFSDPSTIRIAEEAFHNDDNSAENIETAKYILGQLYTAHGFADKALEVYETIDASALGDEALVQSIEVEKALNYALLGDIEEAETLFARVDEAVAANYEAAKFHYDLLEVILHDRVMTPEKKADILSTIRTFRNVKIMTLLEMASDPSEQAFKSKGIAIAVDKTAAMNSGFLVDLKPGSQIERERINSFIVLAEDNLGGSSKAKPREKVITAALQTISSENETGLNNLVRQLRQGPDDQPLADIFDLFRNADTVKLTETVTALEDPEHKTVGQLLLGRSCLARTDYACAWEHLYAAEQQARSVGKSRFVDFLIADSRLTLMSHENNTSEVLKAATHIFEDFSDYIAEPDMTYNIINRVAGAFERTGLTSTAYQIVTLDGAAGMGQPYANHMSEVRLMLALSRYREARDRLDTLGVEGSPLRQTLYEKALNYAAHAALGETDQALSLADQVRTGSRGLKDPLLAGLLEPYLLMGDYHVYTHYRPFEAEEYRVKFLDARRMEDALQVEKSRRLAEARVRAVNAAEMRALDKANIGISNLETRQTTLSAMLWLLLAGLLGAGYFLMRLFGRNKALMAENQTLDHTRRTHQYFMDEMERQTALETTALSSAMDTLSRSSGADPQLMSEKLSGHVTNLKESIARLAFQDRVFTRKPSAPTKINLEILRGELLESWQSAASKKDISILFDVDERVRSVHSYKSLLTESLRLFVGHAIDHTSIDVISVTMTPFRIKDQDYIRTTISDEGDGLASFDARLSPGDVSPDIHASFDESEKQAFAASTAIMAINGAGGRFESEASPGFGHVLTFDLPATLLTSAEELPTPSNIIDFKKGQANEG